MKSKQIIVLFTVLFTVTIFSGITNATAEWDAVRFIGNQYGIDFGNTPGCNNAALSCDGSGNVIGINLNENSQSTPSITSATTSSTTGGTDTTSSTTTGTTTDTYTVSAGNITSTSTSSSNPTSTSTSTPIPSTTSSTSATISTTSSTSTPTPIPSTTISGAGPSTSTSTTTIPTSTSTSTTSTSTTTIPTSTSTSTTSTSTSTTSLPTSTSTTTVPTSTSVSPTSTTTTFTTTVPTSTSVSPTSTTTTTIPTSSTSVSPTSTSTTLSTTTGTPTVTPFPTGSSTQLPINTSDTPIIVQNIKSDLKLWTRRRIYATENSPVNVNNGVDVTYSLLNLKNLVIVNRTPVNESLFVLNNLNIPKANNITIKHPASTIIAQLTSDITTAFPILQYLQISGAINGYPDSIFKHQTLKKLDLSQNDILHTSINNGVTFANAIETLILNTKNQPLSFTIYNASFPALKDFTLYLTSTVNFQNLVERLDYLSIISTNNAGLNMNAASLDPITLTLTGVQITGVTDFSSKTRLLNIYATNIYAPSTSIAFKIPSSLVKYVEKGVTSTTNFPSPSEIKNVKELVLQNPNLSASISLAKYPNLDLLDVSGSPVTTSGGEVPEELCTAKKINLQNTNVLTAVGCFACFKSYVFNWFPAGTVYTLTTTCGSVSNQPPTTGYPIVNGGNFTVEGTNLGWGSSEPGLTIVTPNTKFIYKTAPVSTMPSDPINKTLNIGSGNQITVTYFYATPVVSSANIRQTPNGVAVTITGRNFNSDTVFKIGNEECMGTFYDEFTKYCTITNTLEEGPVTVSVTDSVYGQTTFDSNYLRTYPTVTSVSPISTSGQVTVSIYGNFGPESMNPTPTIPIVVFRQLLNVNSVNVTVLVDSQVCENPTHTTNVLTCQYTPSPTATGLRKLTVYIDNIKYESSRLFYVESNNVQCSGGCGTGTCSNGICICPEGTSGPSCNLQLPNANDQSDLVIVKDKNKPVTAYQLKGVEFGFNMVALQEVDPSDNVVREELLKNWVGKENETSVATVLTYTTQAHTANITAVVEINKVARQIEFANITSNYNVDSMKASVSISGWSFETSLNALRVVIVTSAQSDDSKTCSATSAQQKGETTDTLNYLSIERNGVIFYGRFLDRSLSDGRPSFTSSKIINESISLQDSKVNQTFIGITLPQSDNLIMDPDFSVLVDPNVEEPSCGSSKKNWVVPVAVVVPIVAVSAIAAVAAVYFKKKVYVSRRGLRFKFQSRGSSRDLSMKHL